MLAWETDIGAWKHAWMVNLKTQHTNSSWPPCGGVREGNTLTEWWHYAPWQHMYIFWVPFTIVSVKIFEWRVVENKSSIVMVPSRMSCRLNQYIFIIKSFVTWKKKLKDAKTSVAYNVPACWGEHFCTPTLGFSDVCCERTYLRQVWLWCQEMLASVYVLVLSFPHFWPSGFLRYATTRDEYEHIAQVVKTWLFLETRTGHVSYLLYMHFFFTCTLQS